MTHAAISTQTQPEALADLVAVVTGASSGIGAAIARAFCDAGAQVVVGSRSQPYIDGTTWVRTNVANVADADALIEATRAQHGRIDVLVNNAGVQVEKTIAATTDDEFDQVMGVNVKGVFNCSRAAVRQMQRQFVASGSGGAIINIGSIAAMNADRGMAVYNASKGAVHSLTRAIATDHGAEGIRCNAIAPGWIATDLADAAFDLADDPAAARQRAIAAHPVGRLGLPDDVANLAVWLASDAAAFATGSIFKLDGGLTAGSPI